MALELPQPLTEISTRNVA